MRRADGMEVESRDQGEGEAVQCQGRGREHAIICALDVVKVAWKTAVSIGKDQLLL